MKLAAWMQHPGFLRLPAALGNALTCPARKTTLHLSHALLAQGIKVTDADSKRKAFDALKTQQALKEMEKDQFDLGRLSLGSKGPEKMEQ